MRGYPDVIAGIMVSGTSRLDAGIYQFIVAAMILAASRLAGLVVKALTQRRAFTPQARLALRA